MKSKPKLIKAKAVKDGTFDDGGYFCCKGDIYEGKMYEAKSREEKFYVLCTEDCEEFVFDHGMDQDFFDEYFKIVKGD